MTETLPYGSWPSPIDASKVAAASPRYDGAQFVGDEVWWAETVPAEGGRTTIRRRGRSGAVTDVLAAPRSARSRVHEYGGGSWAASHDGVLFFVEASDQRVWWQRPGRPPVPLTGEDAAARYGGLRIQQGRLIGIREIRSADRPRRDVVEIAADGGVRSLVDGSDFVAQPSLSPGGTHLAWMAWDHPDMPWDRSEVRVGRLEGGGVTEWTVVAGGASAPVQPMWTGPQDLLYADDPTGRWNLQRLHLSADLPRQPVAPADADTGGPLWTLGTRWFLPLEDGRIVAVRTDGHDAVVVIDAATGSERRLALPTAGGSASLEDARGTAVLLTLTGSDGPPALWRIDIDRPGEAERVAGAENPWGAEWMPRPRAVTFPGPHGPVHAVDFPPTSPLAGGPADEAPPYVVQVHGGPTAHVSGAASGKTAYLTSRGIGVLEVNYGGSSGYGRAYRERLRGQWGVVDVDDVAAAATGLAAEGRADPARLAVAGGSAGGWTVLSALTNTDVFAAGISRYGVGDARALAAEAHDFESRYLDGLIGPLPEAEDVYIQRSPLSHADRFAVPVLLLQGADDTVVPPAQSEAVRDALASRGIPHSYVLYEGEGHGFRRADTIADMLERELAFLAAVFGLRPAGVDPLRLA